MDDSQGFGNIINKWSIQVFESKHDAGLSGPSCAPLEPFEKIRLRLLVTRLVKNIIRHDLDDSQTYIPGKLDGLAQDSLPLPADLRHVTAKRIFAMAAQAHGHDLHAAVGNGTTQFRSFQ